MSDLAAVLAGHAARHGVPGAAVGVLRDGAVTAAYHGVADVRTGEPVTPATRFAVGSLGKSMVATAAVRRLALDDPVAAQVPELRDAAWARRATIRDLMANRSGVPLRAAVEFTGWPDADDAVLGRVAAAVATGEPMPFWSYANAGWAVLGRALETATGLVWEEAMRAELLGPLGMGQTAYRPDGLPCAGGHRGTEPVVPWTPRHLGPAGSTVLSTVDDMLRFARAQVDDPGLAGLRATHADLRIEGWFDAWCLGFGRFDWPGGPVWGWDGMTGGQRSVLRLVPHRRGAVVLLTNSDSGRALYRSLFPDLMRSWFGVSMPSVQSVAGEAGDLARFAGVYAWPDRRWEVSVAGGALVLSGPDGRLVGIPVDGCTFLVDPDDPDAPTMTFGGFDEEGRPGVLYELLWGLPRVGRPAA